MDDRRDRKVDFKAAALGRCPVCEKGRLYTSYLKVAKACNVCGADFASANSGDGPVVFVILIAGMVACAGLAVSFLKWNWPPLMLLTVWPAVAVGLSLVLMPMLKGVMVASQVANKVRD
jgi:uncharacterized protein (DUF983 family)